MTNKFWTFFGTVAVSIWIFKYTLLQAWFWWFLGFTLIIVLALIFVYVLFVRPFVVYHKEK